MADRLQFSFDADLQVLQIGFAAGWDVCSVEDLALFAGEITRHCEGLPQRVHFFFDLDNLRVAAEFVEQFGQAKRALGERFALSTWHFGGNLAERVMTRNDLTRRGQRPNLYRNRAEALEAFRRGESPAPSETLAAGQSDERVSARTARAPRAPRGRRGA